MEYREKKEFIDLEKDLTLSSGRKVHVWYDMDAIAIETYHVDPIIKADPLDSYEGESEWEYKVEGFEVHTDEEESFTESEIKEIDSIIAKKSIKFVEENFWEVSSNVVYGCQLKKVLSA